MYILNVKNSLDAGKNEIAKEIASRIVLENKYFHELKKP